MRKEVKIGLAVGAVLFAVVVVYLITAATSRERKGTNLAIAPGDPGTMVTPDPHDRPAPQDTPAPHRDTPAPADTPAPSSNGGVARTDTPAPESGTGDTGGYSWRTLLTMGADVPREPMRTLTPGPAGADPIPSPEADRHINVINPDPARAIDPAPARGGMAMGPATRPSQTHRVQEGENFWTIARAVYGNASYCTYIQKANPNIAPNKLRPGMTIQIPDLSDLTTATPGGGATIPVSADRVAPAGIPVRGPLVERHPATRPIDPTKTYVVKSGDSLYAISRNLYGRGDKADKIYQLNKDTIGPDPARLKLNMVLLLPEPPAVTALR